MQDKAKVNALMLLSIFLSSCGAQISPKDSNNIDISVYSNACLHRSTGDLMGDSIILYDLHGKEYALVQRSEGVIGRVQVANIDRDEIHITINIVNSDERTSSFKGKIESRLVRGRFYSKSGEALGDEEVVLKRVRNSSATVPNC